MPPHSIRPSIGRYFPPYRARPLSPHTPMIRPAKNDTDYMRGYYKFHRVTKPTLITMRSAPGIGTWKNAICPRLHLPSVLRREAERDRLLRWKYWGWCIG